MPLSICHLSAGLHRFRVRSIRVFRFALHSRGPASAKDHRSLLTEVQEFAATAVDGAVTVLQLCRSIITKVCDPGSSCCADPGVEIPSQQDMAF